MGNVDVIAYNVAAFVSTLFLLEFGADKFVDHTAIVAKRTGIPATTIALLTAGAEWEERVVVVASLIQGRSSLAVGNIVGSAISNLLGAFSLGLVFHRGEAVQFDNSSRVYSIILLLLTTCVTPLAYLKGKTWWTIFGAVLIAVFAIYMVSIGWAISKGSLTAPEDSDSDSGDDESSDGGSTRPSLSDEPLLEEQRRNGGLRYDSMPSQRNRTSLTYHVFQLTLGFLAICVAGYVLSHAATNIIDAIGASDVVFGIIFLAIATTLPEKFVAVISSHRGHSGIMVANAVGSNIFLLSLCLGIIMVDTSGEFNSGGVNVYELGVLWASTLCFTLTVWVGARFTRYVGGAMLLGYIAFIVLEFTVI
ncbi:hypothetical protein BKA56DRAFT_451002, partial [Ilyonectria sp. MPI-CAGE-AT-0026]